MSDEHLNLMMYGGALLGIGQITLAVLWWIFLIFVIVKALLTFIALRRIAEQNLELNRALTAHAEKSAAMLVAIRDRLEKNAKAD